MKSVRGLLVAGALAGLSAAAADASVTYTFSTFEPFAGGTLNFTYIAPSFVASSSFIDASALLNATPSIQRVRFDGGCTDGGGPACDQITIFSASSFGSTMTNRYFADSAFGSANTYVAARGASATLTVAEGAVPEPATWAMFIGGFGLIGLAMRRRHRTTVSFA